MSARISKTYASRDKFSNGTSSFLNVVLVIFKVAKTKLTNPKQNIASDIIIGGISI